MMKSYQPIRKWIPLAAMFFLPIGCARRIPPEYEYPQGWITNSEKDHALVQSLSGVVNDGSGAPIQFVLVERMSSDFKRRIEATLTDEKGSFRFRHAHGGNHYLRFRFRGFNDYEIPVIVSPKAKKHNLTVEMSVST
jgi:Carboxypeptidase regulatory-like domain